MKNILLWFVICFLSDVAIGQHNVATDDFKSHINVRFTSVEFSNAWACEAEMEVGYEIKSETITLFFEVPNYDTRYKTTKEDYAIIKIKDKEIRLQNSAEFDANGLIQKFVFKVSKVSMQELLDDGFKKITFYFAPNEDFIVKRLAAEKNLNPEYREIISQLAKKTAQTTIWNPDKKKLQELKMWFEKL